MESRQIKILLVLLIPCLLYACTAVSSSEGSKIDRGSVYVGKVSDGDTVETTVKGTVERIRLIGIDAPELDQKPWGKKGKKYLQEIIAASGWQVGIEYDIERHDKHGRILAYLWTRDGKMINEEMLKSGHAVLYTIPPNVKHAGRLKTAQIIARENRIGIWGKSGLSQLPSDYRKEHPRR